MNKNLFKEIFSPKELEGEFLKWARCVLDPQKIVSDRGDRKIRIYKSLDFSIENSIDIKFIWQANYSENEAGQWVAKVWEGNRESEPIEFYLVEHLCSFLEKKFNIILAE